MGDRYSWEEPCPDCGNTIECYFSDSSSTTTARCHKCGAEFDIRLSFGLIEKHRPGGEVSRPVAESAHSGRNATPPGSTITDEQPAPGENERVKIDNLCQQVEYCFGYFIMNPGIQSSAEFKKAKIEIQKYLRSRLSQPQPAMVSREQVKKWFPCRCEEAWTSRGLTMPGCPYHDTLWEELLEDLGHTVEGGEGGKG
jgi:hypothetical protein